MIFVVCYVLQMYVPQKQIAFLGNFPQSLCSQHKIYVLFLLVLYVSSPHFFEAWVLILSMGM
jgi:hypothetical protein